MTDRRPDIYCLGCHTYCYSLSHLPYERVESTAHYCEECQAAVDRGMRSGAMLNHAWYMLVEVYCQKFQKKRKLSEAAKSKIDSFGWTMRYSCSPKERPFKDDPNKMTVAEWKDIAKLKLTHYQQYCNKEELLLINEFISSAR
jgi:hypothetical protein